MIAYTYIIATIENSAVSSKIIYIVSSQSKFVLFDLLITVNFSKYKKTTILYFLYMSKKVSCNNFYENECFCQI